MRRLLRWLAALAVLSTFAWVAAVMAVFLYGLRDEARPADAIVVLGAAQYDGRPSPVLRARLDHAIGLYRQGIAPHVIFTGGVGVGDTVSEAEVGSRYAVKAGIPADSIMIEPAGLSTEQSLTTVKQMMERAGLRTAVLVSDPFHMLRLRLLASEMGIRAYSSPTRSSPIGADSPEEWRHVLRESLILPFALFGHL